MIAIFVAIAKNNVIGSKNDLPWYIPEDLKRFKALTTGHTVVMGRKTYDSIIKRLGKPLPNRKNVVITSQKDFAVPEGVEVFGTLDEAFHAHEKDEIIFAIGGARIFAEALPKADRLYITHVDKEYEGDVYFPEVDWTSFSKVKEEQHDGFSFADYHRIKKIAWGGKMRNFFTDKPTIYRLVQAIIVTNGIQGQISYEELHTQLSEVIERDFESLSPSERCAIFTETIYRTSSEEEVDIILAYWQITKNVSPKQLASEILMFSIWKTVNPEFTAYPINWKQWARLAWLSIPIDELGFSLRLGPILR